MIRAAFFLVVTALVATASVSARETPPNVIVVITDDQGYGDLGAHGNTMIQTPNLDKLYGHSVRLTDYHVDPTCSPTRSALMTGRYSTRTGVWHTIMGRSIMSPKEHTLAEVFQDNGYQTGMFGKWHLGDNYPCRPADQGFTYTFHHGGGGVGQGPDYWGNDYFDDTYWRNGKVEPQTGYCTDVWFSDALRFIEKNRKRPFFAYISTNAPHGPYLVDKKYSQPYKDKGVGSPQAEFYGMIENIDENVGRLVEKLAQLKLTENTILVFTTDNGSAAGHRVIAGAKWQGFNAGMRAGKGSEYDGGHRVPFFVHWPQGELGGGRDVTQLSAHIDVLPTLVDLCELKDHASATRDGTSLKAALYGNEDVLRDRTLLVHSQRVEYPEKFRKCAVMTDRWRLVNNKELFDIEKDPGQKQNIADEHPEVVTRLAANYDAWWTSLSPVFDQFVRIGIGSRAEPESLLHAHDWHTEGNLTPWHQNHIRQGAMGTGYWALEILQEGTYEIELRRWPRQVNKPLDTVEATIELAGQKMTIAIPDESTQAVTFEVQLPKGPADLHTHMKLPNGKTRGSYFAYVKRIK
ncbi:MAG: arylsulfatase [Planctomycetota bacterium]|nr:arylsulfatase [Planctomycetota bacterium]